MVNHMNYAANGYNSYLILVYTDMWVNYDDRTLRPHWNDG